MYPLPDKTPTEEKLITFDFAVEAVVGSVLSLPTVDKSVVSGTDHGAAALTVGPVSIDGLQAQALVSGGIDGVTYRLACTVAADNGEVHQIIATLAVAVDAA
jgi:hypothetical protein